MGVMLLIIASASGGNIYTQKVMQRKMDQPLMLQNAMLYGWGILFNGINWMFSVNSGSTVGYFGKVGSIQICSVVFYAIYGLSISIILKNFGAMTRTLINTTAICFTAILDVAFFGETISMLEGTTFAVIFIAVYQHSILSKDYKPEVPSLTKLDETEVPLVASKV